MTLASLILSIIGAIGVLPVVIGATVIVGRLHRARRVLRFDRNGPIDVVLTTSEVMTHDVGVIVQRPITGFGQVTGLVSCVRTLSARYRKKEIRVHLSGFVRNRVERDLVCLGGPVRNEVSRQLLSGIQERYVPAINFKDAERSLTIDSDPNGFREEEYDPGVNGGAPAQDLGLVVVVNRQPTADGIFRAILCAGFTTFGTAAAAEYAFSDLPKLRNRALRALVGSSSRGRPYEFAIVVRAQFSRGECIEVRPVYGTTLYPRSSPRS